MERPSKTYKLMMYFVHATICMYEKTVKSSEEMNPPEFRKVNKAIIQRVFDEGLSIMNYEISDRQMEIGVYSYLSSKYKPQSVETSEVYCLPSSIN